MHPYSHSHVARGNAYRGAILHSNKNTADKYPCSFAVIPECLYRESSVPIPGRPNIVGWVELAKPNKCRREAASLFFGRPRRGWVSQSFGRGTLPLRPFPTGGGRSGWGGLVPMLYVGMHTVAPSSIRTKIRPSNIPVLSPSFPSVFIGNPASLVLSLGGVGRAVSCLGA
ncbi:hypothetical protein SAMN02745216_01690 [Desulfatibacillum alkenivorans DSM 16219]|uniref:Uncharacterized protein n=1 Tax=Desulfatibacillum alkenivorans DSM 16219 TaxID=1121393 RepID=A0A1M6JJX3_9BACT|nr:hypothetical protein SAMN02745216_01690 [Desulfatibacillum alkenivorans DSM 16219]